MQRRPLRSFHEFDGIPMMKKSKDGERIDSDFGEHTRQVVVTITATIPEFHQVRARDEEGNEYAITGRTEGVELASLCEGLSLVCTVSIRLPRVLRAVLVQSGTQAAMLPLGVKKSEE